MKHDSAEILKKALDLPPEARAVIAGSLLYSLDDEAESAWEDEIVMRLEEIDEGKVNLVPWVEARRRIAGK